MKHVSCPNAAAAACIRASVQPSAPVTTGHGLPPPSPSANATACWTAAPVALTALDAAAGQELVGERRRPRQRLDQPVGEHPLAVGLPLVGVLIAPREARVVGEEHRQRGLDLRQLRLAV